MTRRLASLAAALVLAAGSSAALAQVGTAVTYQGQLKSQGSNVNSPTDFRFSLWDAATGGNQVGATDTRLGVGVTGGLFTAAFDCGVNPYTADRALYLQIEVRNPGGSGSYVPMGSRQRLTGTPFSEATRGVSVDATGGASVSALRIGNGALDDGSGARSLIVKRNPLQNIYMSFQDADSGVNDWEWRGDNGTARLDLYAGFDKRVTFLQGGSVGIGTDTPGRLLHLKGSSVGMFFQDTNDADGASAKWSLDTGAFGIPGIALVRYDATGVANDSRSLFVNNNGNMGVGISVPGAKLDVGGAARITGGDPSVGEPTMTLAGPGGALLSARNTSGGFTGWDVYMGSTNYAISRYGIDFPFLISASTGNAAIGTGLSTFKLDVGGTVRCTALTQTSAREFKQDIVPLTGALDAVMKLNPVSYAWNDKAPEQVQGKHDIGFIADEVNQVLPDIVAKDESGKPVGIDYGKITPVTVEAIKQLKAENDALKARLEKIEAMLAAQTSAK